MRISAAVALFLVCCTQSHAGGVHARFLWDDDQLYVHTVEPGPARDAGLRVNDRIMSIDGTAVDSLSYEQVVSRLRGAQGTTVTLEVLRNGELLTITATREPYISRPKERGSP